MAWNTKIGPFSLLISNQARIFSLDLVDPHPLMHLRPFGDEFVVHVLVVEVQHVCDVDCAPGREENHVEVKKT